MKAMSALGAVSMLILTPLLTNDLHAQPRNMTFEARGGVNVPTFDIADVAEAGPSFGVGVAVPLGHRISLLGDADFGFHSGENDGPDINVFHYIGKLAYDVLEPEVGPWMLRVNAGAGAMTFDVDGADSNTYFAINVGAKIGYAVTDRIHLLLSPQGDIAFSDEDELGTDNAWIWPFAAGVQIQF